MATLLSELLRTLSAAAARELRARAEGPPLSRPEMIALATLHELSAAIIAAGAPPAEQLAVDRLEALSRLAAFDMSVVNAARARTM